MHDPVQVSRILHRHGIPTTQQVRPSSVPFNPIRRAEPEPQPQPASVNRLGQPTVISMKNGKYRVVLLAGGPRDLAIELREKLARQRGLYVKYHLAYRKPLTWARPVPPDVDLVIHLRDACSHDDTQHIKIMAKKAGVRIISTSDKMSILNSSLGNFGIRMSELPEDTIARMKFDDDLPETKQTEFLPEPAAVVEVPVVGEALAKAPLKEEPPAPILLPAFVHPPAKSPADESVDLIIKEAISPITLPELQRGQPSAQLSVLANALFRMCAAEQVQVLCTPKELTFSSVA